MDQMNIHIIGIAGAMTAPLAVTLRQLGHHITGSDQEKIYPPTSDILSGIALNQPLGSIDLCIVGSSYQKFTNCSQEFELIKRNHVPYISATNYIAQNLVKKNSIIVAGSYGKTTITAILAHVMPQANYFFGGLTVSGQPSLQFTESDWSIVEGDESINGLDDQAKFLYYPTKYVILTSVNWEHHDSYSTAEANLEAYRRLVTNIPEDGLLIYNPDDPQIKLLLPFCRGQSVPYVKKHFETLLIGEHNQQNISAAYTLCHHLKVNFNIADFKGIRRRLQIVSQKNNILFIDDFAQSATRVLAALRAIKYSYPHQRLVVYFEPHASFLQYPESITGFKQVCPLIDTFILGKIKFSPNKDTRVTAADWQQQLGSKLVYLPLCPQIETFLKSHLQPNDILVHFSSGGNEGLHTLQQIYNNI